MREIKFRAWTKRDDCWIGGFSIHQSGLFSDLINAKIEEPQHIAIADAHWQVLSKQDDIVVMQYTGLKDKAGRDIYEGDILLNPKYGKAEVVFQYGCFGVDIYSPYKLGSGFYSFNTIIADYENCEVIGNVYENPELINKI